jgi:ABC-type antimicrobial peptide transport system permease subunit
MVKEGEREFRVLRALGLTRRGLRMLIVLASVLLSGLGGLLGVGAGALLSNGVSIAVYIWLKLNYVAPEFQGVVTAGSIVLAVSLGLAGGLITALWGGLEGRIGVD